MGTVGAGGEVSPLIRIGGLQKIYAANTASPVHALSSIDLDIAARIYWFLPVRWLIKDPFRSDLRIGKVTAPVLVLHGDRDNIVPIALGEQLYALIEAPKRFVRFPGAGHNELGARGALDEAKQFLDGG